MTKFLTICQNTFVQTIRQPIFGILVLVTFAALVLITTMPGWSMTTDYVRMDLQSVHELGLSTILIFIGVLLASFSASGALSREIDDRTALTVISKPVSRGTFLLGKFAGVWAAVTVAFYLCAIVFLMTIRHRPLSNAGMEVDWPVVTLGLAAMFGAILIGMAGNYLFGWPFTSAAVWSALALFTVAMGVLLFVGKEWTLLPAKYIGYDAIPTEHSMDTYQLITGQRILGIGLIYVATMVLCAISVAASTRLGQIATLLVCGAVWIVGTIHPRLVELAHQWPAMNLLTWVSPDLTRFYSVDTEKPMPLDAAAAIAGYGLAYIAAMLALGIALFQTRQLESQATSSTMPGVVGIVAWLGRITAILMAGWGLNMLGLLLKPEPYLVQEFGADKTFLAAAGVTMLAFAIGTWLLWGSFSRGKRWAYWTVLTISLLDMVYALCVLLVPALREAAILRSDRQLTIAAVVAGIFLLILLLPRTRRHFGFGLRKKLATETQRAQS